MMRKYETIFVAHPSLDEEAVKALIEKFKGKRKLAYEIAKVNEGYYTLINFTANPELPKELDRVFGITDGIIRHIIVKEEQ